MIYLYVLRSSEFIYAKFTSANEIYCIFPFLLSEHILCKESIVVVKKIDFQISTYLYVLRSSEFIYAIFMVICMYVCVCLCVWGSMIASNQCIQLSSNLVCILQVTVGRILFILVNIGWIVFLQEYKKEFLYITAYGAKFFKVF